MSQSDELEPPFQELLQGLSVLEGLKRDRSRPARDRVPHWPELGLPVVDRGGHAIFPLAAAAMGAGDTRSVERLDAAWERMRLHCVHLYGGGGFHAETHLDLNEGYGRRLAVAPGGGEAVIGPVYAWRIEDFAAVLVRSLERPRSLQTLALHVVPARWIWPVGGFSPTKRDRSGDRRAAKERNAADASWSWAEAIVLHEALLEQAGRFDLSEAIDLYLCRYPGRNENGFRARYGGDTEVVRYAVRMVLDETVRIQPRSWEGALTEIGVEVRDVMRERHPSLSDAAIHRLGNYFTYLVK